MVASLVRFLPITSLSSVVLLASSAVAQPPAGSPPAPSAAPEVQPEVRTPAPTPPPLTEVLFKNLKARAIGPTVMGGRISDIAIDPRNPGVFYVGHAHGGVWKTNDNGATFDPIFDKESALSIGAIGIAPSEPDVVYVGTGEANDRNSSGWGNGVYRSSDAGSTWQNVGLKDSRAIGRIIVHPKDPNVVYAAVSGHLWADGGE